MLSLKVACHSLRTTGRLNRWNLFIIRSARTSPKPPPFGARLKLLAGPTLLTISVGSATYASTFMDKSSHKQSRRFRRNNQKLFEFNLLTAIVGVNVGVFTLWRFGSPAIVAFLNKYMMSSLYKPTRTLSMIGSMLSHQSLLHLFVNMYVLVSFASVPDTRTQLLHLYLTGGLAASWMSYLVQAVKVGYVQSLGASGAILALAGYTAGKYPEARFSLAFVDSIYPHSFTAQSAFYGLLCFDTCGLLFGWKFLDHGGHIGGILYGWLHSHTS